MFGDSLLFHTPRVINPGTDRCLTVGDTAVLFFIQDLDRYACRQDYARQ